MKLRHHTIRQGSSPGFHPQRANITGQSRVISHCSEAEVGLSQGHLSLLQSQAYLLIEIILLDIIVVVNPTGQSFPLLK